MRRDENGAPSKTVHKIPDCPCSDTQFIKSRPMRQPHRRRPRRSCALVGPHFPLPSRLAADKAASELFRYCIGPLVRLHSAWCALKCSRKQFCFSFWLALVVIVTTGILTTVAIVLLALIFLAKVFIGTVAAVTMLARVALRAISVVALFRTAMSAMSCHIELNKNTV